MRSYLNANSLISRIAFKIKMASRVAEHLKKAFLIFDDDLSSEIPIYGIA